MNQRDWKFPSRQDSVGGKSQEEFIERPTSLNHKQRMGEILHITRPLVHCILVKLEITAKLIYY